GSAADDFVEAISLDKKGSLYVTGWTRGSLPGGAEQSGTPNPNAGGADIFLAKINTQSGEALWINQAGTGKDDFAYGVATDRSGLVYVVGSTNGAMDGATDPGDHSDAFIMQFNTTGDKIYANQFNVATPARNTYAYAVAVDSTNARFDYIFVTGLVQAYENGSLFVARFDTWLDTDTRKIVTSGGPLNGSDDDFGRAIALDSKGNVIVAGSTSGAFDGKVSSGSEDIIVVKYTNGLNKLWSFQYGTTTNDVAYGVAVDAEDSIYITGITGYPGGPGLDGQTYLGASDIFLARLSSDGQKLFTRQVGTTVQDWAYGITIDASGAIYLAGATEGTFGESNSGIIDAVWIKYDKDGPVPRPVTEFYINGTVRELPSDSGLESVSITIKDDLGTVVGDYLTNSSGRFDSKVTKAGRYFIHKLKIGYTAQVDPDEVELTAAAPVVAPVSFMEKIVVKTQMSFRKGYDTIRFTKLPAGDRSVNAVFGKYAGNPYVGLIFSFDRPMQYLLLANQKTVGNIKALEFGRSYMIYTSKPFVIDTTYWVGPEPLPATILPASKFQGKVRN
ncbi:MAG TPA: SBBP repeat-containing protein, partial [Syntrophales bacterium]|nr:SBBP repeat-containing protein [Syntrophales bacterium]